MQAHICYSSSHKQSLHSLLSPSFINSQMSSLTVYLWYSWMFLPVLLSHSREMPASQVLIPPPESLSLRWPLFLFDGSLFSPILQVFITLLTVSLQLGWHECKKVYYIDKCIWVPAMPCGGSKWFFTSTSMSYRHCMCQWVRIPICDQKFATSDWAVWFHSWALEQAS